MDNLGFLFTANVFVWGGIVFYVYMLKQRNRSLEKDLNLLKETVSKDG
ncbi:MAG: CcmD family protein [Nitrospinae bacterium]|nr:CcmD family protein [Nitrospinota bacterium]